MDGPSVHAELAFLKEALRAHLGTLASSGAHGLAPCDEATLAARRERYRELARIPVETAEEDSTALASPPPEVSAPSFSAPLTKPTPRSIAETPSAVAAPSREVASPREASPPREVVSLREALPAREVVPTREAAPARGWRERLATAAPAEERLHRLQLLEAEVKTCQRCVLAETRTQTVFSRGSGKSGICFIGEGPGAEEDARGQPFVGAAGQLLDKMIQAMGLGRDDVYVCNIVKCRPPNNRQPAPNEMSACRDYLTEQLELIQPKVIVALGGTAVQGLLGLNMGITKLRGQWRVYRGEIPVMPTFHPAYLLRQPGAKRQVWDDLKLVLKHLGVDGPG
jgi:uracil-DNA glycosylase